MALTPRSGKGHCTGSHSDKKGMRSMAKGIRLETVAPALFVLIWSTGWIVGKYLSFHGDPLTFLVYRFIFATIVFGIIALLLKAKWPKTRAGWLHAIVSGFFLHTVYLGGVWWAIRHGVPASVSGLLAALQPLMTAVIARWAVSEHLRGEQKLGLALGFVGLMVAIGPRLLALDSAALTDALSPLAINVVAMISVTIGTVYQKRFLQEGDLLPIATLQFLGALIFMVPLAWLFEEMEVQWNTESILAMVWSVFGLSLGAITLLLYLIRRGQVSKAASLIYLIPPTVGIEAWFLFGETPNAFFVIGTLIVVIGVWLVNRKPKQAK